jgi:hypothetical protein
MQSSAVAVLLPIQHAPEDDFGELHDELPQLLVLFKQRIQLQTIRVGSRCGRIERAVAVSIRRMHASHG